MRAGTRLIIRILAIFGIALAAVATGAAPSLAQSQKLIKQCASADLDLAIEACTKLIDTPKIRRVMRAIFYSNRGRMWAEKGDRDLADADLNESIRLESLPIFYQFRGQVFSSYYGEHDRAIEDYNEALRLLPKQTASTPAADKSGIYSDRGTARKRKGDNDGAMADYNEAIRAGPGPNYPLAYENRSLLWRDLGDYDRAMADLDKAIKLQPKHAHFFASRATIWQLRGDLDRALADASKAVKLDPKHTLYLCYRGEIRRYRNEFSESLRDYDAAIRLDPEFAMAYTGRGLTHEKSGDLVHARADFERSLAITRFRDSLPGAHETARARLAALDAGTPQQSAGVVLAPSSATSSVAAPPQPSAGAPTVAAAPQGRRVALVIGNSAYKAVPALPNPQRDAEAIAGALRKVGFDVVTVSSDATREQLIEALRQFAGEAEKSDWAMVYYAGHGIEVGGTNYLIPVDAKLATDRDAQLEAVSIDQVLVGVEGAKKLKLIVMDACRDNPFVPQMRRTASAQLTMGIQSGGTPAAGTRSVGRGLAEVKPEGAMLVVFAAKHGQLALDGESTNSPFATAFVQRVGTPGVKINKLIRLVRDDVMEATAGRQEPFTYGSLPGREDFFFVAGK
jgi:tetratricopeptide (TPR) repeat protein